MVMDPVFHEHEANLQITDLHGGDRTIRVRRPLKQMPFPPSPKPS